MSTPESCASCGASTDLVERNSYVGGVGYVWSKECRDNAACWGRIDAADADRGVSTYVGAAIHRALDDAGRVVLVARHAAARGRWDRRHGVYNTGWAQTDTAPGRLALLAYDEAQGRWPATA